MTTWFDGKHTIWDIVDHCNYTSISRRFLDTATDWLTYCGPVGLTSLEFRKDDAISGYDAIPACDERSDGIATSVSLWMNAHPRYIHNKNCLH